jgi:hypothetical protein
MTATAMINQGMNLPVEGIVTSCSSSSYFAATATMHHPPAMSLPEQCSITTDLA